MQRYKILHRTYYNFSGAVQLDPHTLRLRPREGPELQIESSALNITPSPATLRWHRDAEDNAIAIVTFDVPTEQLVFESEVILQQFNLAPLDFLLAEYATNFPFAYTPEDSVILAPYLTPPGTQPEIPLIEWTSKLFPPGEKIQTYAVLQRLCQEIHSSISYQKREEPGVQTATQTLTSGTGSCRDYANLFIQAARHLRLAARFVSGYLHAPPAPGDFGATHAWAEAYLPGAGWKGFDPTIGDLVGSDHFAVAVARLPESVPPIAGSFVGIPGSNIDVGVWVSKL